MKYSLVLAVSAGVGQALVFGRDGGDSVGGPLGRLMRRVTTPSEVVTAQSAKERFEAACRDIETVLKGNPKLGDANKICEEANKQTCEGDTTPDGKDRCYERETRLLQSLRNPNSNVESNNNKLPIAGLPAQSEQSGNGIAACTKFKLKNPPTTSAPGGDCNEVVRRKCGEKQPAELGKCQVKEAAEWALDSLIPETENRDYENVLGKSIDDIMNQCQKPDKLEQCTYEGVMTAAKGQIQTVCSSLTLPTKPTICEDQANICTENGFEKCINGLVTVNTKTKNPVSTNDGDVQASVDSNGSGNGKTNKQICDDLYPSKAPLDGMKTKRQAPSSPDSATESKTCETNLDKCFSLPTGSSVTGDQKCEAAKKNLDDLATKECSGCPQTKKTECVNKALGLNKPSITKGQDQPSNPQAPAIQTKLGSSGPGTPAPSGWYVTFKNCLDDKDITESTNNLQKSPESNPASVTGDEDTKNKETCQALHQNDEPEKEDCVDALKNCFPGKVNTPQAKPSQTNPQINCEGDKNVTKIIKETGEYFCKQKYPGDGAENDKEKCEDLAEACARNMTASLRSAQPQGQQTAAAPLSNPEQPSKPESDGKTKFWQDDLRTCMGLSDAVESESVNKPERLQESCQKVFEHVKTTNAAQKCFETYSKCSDASQPVAKSSPEQIPTTESTSANSQPQPSDNQPPSGPQSQCTLTSKDIVDAADYCDGLDGIKEDECFKAVASCTQNSSQGSSSQDPKQCIEVIKRGEAEISQLSEGSFGEKLKDVKVDPQQGCSGVSNSKDCVQTVTNCPLDRLAAAAAGLGRAPGAPSSLDAAQSRQEPQSTRENALSPAAGFPDTDGQKRTRCEIKADKQRLANILASFIEKFCANEAFKDRGVCKELFPSCNDPTCVRKTMYPNAASGAFGGNPSQTTTSNGAVKGPDSDYKSRAQAVIKGYKPPQTEVPNKVKSPTDMSEARVPSLSEQAAGVVNKISDSKVRDYAKCNCPRYTQPETQNTCAEEFNKCAGPGAAKDCLDNALSSTNKRRMGQNLETLMARQGDAAPIAGPIRGADPSASSSRPADQSAGVNSGNVDPSTSSSGPVGQGGGVNNGNVDPSINRGENGRLSNAAMAAVDECYPADKDDINDPEVMGCAAEALLRGNDSNEENSCPVEDPASSLQKSDGSLPDPRPGPDPKNERLGNQNIDSTNNEEQNSPVTSDGSPRQTPSKNDGEPSNDQTLNSNVPTSPGTEENQEQPLRSKSSTAGGNVDDSQTSQNDQASTNSCNEGFVIKVCQMVNGKEQHCTNFPSAGVPSAGVPSASTQPAEAPSKRDLGISARDLSGSFAAALNAGH